MFSAPVHPGSKSRGRESMVHAIRHALATFLIAALIVPLGAAALLHGREASKRIVLDEQENFSSIRTASSEAGR